MFFVESYSVAVHFTDVHICCTASVISYYFTCKSADISALHYRQTGGDTIEIYKVLFGKYDAGVIFRVNKELSYVAKGNDLRLEKGRSEYDWHRYYFCFKKVKGKGSSYSITERREGSGADPGSWQSACR